MISKLIEDPLLSISETARCLGVSRSMVNNWLDAGRLPYVKLPPGRGKGIYRNRRIRQVDLDDFLEKHYHTGRPNCQSKVSDRIILLPRNP